MKKYIAIMLLGVLVLLSAGAFAQQTIPTATRVFSTTVSGKVLVHVQAGTTGRKVVLNKGDAVPVASKTTLGANVAIVNKYTGKTIWEGRAGNVTITGVSSTTATKDSLNVKWLEDNL
ncbi:hypothetical protein IC229_33215 [Spirosoma sp. BT702]|uniref:DUF5666 domain-containing protein n=1 Tax=Spirosoma profusum TaxID=2771354 RepID=A0A927GAL2_9BACT|nr:hypothetical protein [Spirosoma profusum]MBD2705518.1 hypothetical protein [Spirosoma profusum]